MSLDINFFTTLTPAELNRQIENVKAKHPNIFATEFGLSEAFETDERDQQLVSQLGSNLKVASHFMAWPSKTVLTLTISDMVEAVKGEFEPDQIIALWEMDEII